MRIQKIKDTFNDYRVELSWGQLNAVYRALEKDHADPLADELFAELGWYLENVPGPGEDEEEYKDAKEAEKMAVEGGEEAGLPGEGRDTELLGQEIGAEGPGAGGELEGAGPPAEGAPEFGGEPGEPGAPAEPGASEADRFLERPPTPRE
jgi:hypothetical protein